jgi:F420-dependent methylenetetrahydromethanopterin dehydrogenase
MTSTPECEKTHLAVLVLASPEPAQPGPQNRRNLALKLELPLDCSAGRPVWLHLRRKIVL